MRTLRGMGGILHAYRGLLRNRPLVRLLVGEWVSSIGDWLYLVAILVLVYQVTSDPVVLGILGAARVLPYVVLSVPAGIIVDRFDRRLVLLVTDLARGALMVVIAILVAAGGPLWLTLALVVLSTCFATFFGPAIGAYLPALVADEAQLGPANSAWSTLDHLAFVVGPAIGGILIATGGLVLSFVLNAVSFGVVALVLARLPANLPGGGIARGPAEPTPATAPAEPADAVGSSEPVEAPGTSIAASTPSPAGQALRAALAPLAGLTLISMVGSVAGGGLSVLTVVIAVGDLHGGEEATGFLNAGLGAGGLAGALIAGALVLRPSLAPVLAGGSVVLGVGLAALGYAPSLVLAMAALAVAAAGALLVEVTSTTVLQRVVPDAVRGRTLGVLETTSTIAYAAGAFALPILAGALGTGPVLAAVGVAVVAAGLAGTALAAAADRRPSGAPRAGRVAELASLPIFAGVPAAALEAISADLRVVQVVAGEVVIRQGEAADRFYVIDEGRFDVSRVGAEGDGAGQLEEPPTTPGYLRTMGPGEVFGEIGLMRSSPRTATVVAATDGRLLALDGTTFLRLVNAAPFVGPRLLDLRRGAPGTGG